MQSNEFKLAQGWLLIIPDQGIHPLGSNHGVCDALEEFDIQGLHIPPNVSHTGALGRVHCYWLNTPYILRSQYRLGVSFCLFSIYFLLYSRHVFPFKWQGKISAPALQPLKKYRKLKHITKLSKTSLWVLSIKRKTNKQKPQTQTKPKTKETKT